MKTVKPCQLRAIQRIIPLGDRDLLNTTIKRLASLKVVYETGAYLTASQARRFRDDLVALWEGHGVKVVLWHPLKEDPDSWSPPRPVSELSRAPAYMFQPDEASQKACDVAWGKKDGSGIRGITQDAITGPETETRSSSGEQTAEHRLQHAKGRHASLQAPYKHEHQPNREQGLAK